MEEEKKESADERNKRWEEMWAMKVLKGTRASWYTWNSPVGLGLILVEIGVFLWLLHLADIIH